MCPSVLKKRSKSISFCMYQLAHLKVYCDANYAGVLSKRRCKTTYADEQAVLQVNDNNTQNTAG